MDLDILLNAIPFLLAFLYWLKADEHNINKARGYLGVATLPFLIPEINQFDWLRESLIWIGTAIWLILAKYIVWVGSPQLAATLNYSWLGKWELRILGALILIAYAKENLY